MKLGIRLMPGPDAIPIIEQLMPSVVEVRYDPADSTTNTPLFEYLKYSYAGDVGVSLRGTLNTGELPNFVYPDSSLNLASIQYITAGLNLASSYGFKYLNMYPGTRTRVQRDLDTKTLLVTSGPADLTDSANTFLETAPRLTILAADKNITLTFETLPPQAIHDHATVEPSISEVHGYNLPVEVLERAATNFNVKIANNLTHTAANLPHGTRDELWEYLFGKTSMMAPWTRILYIGSQHLPEIPNDPQNEHIFMPTKSQFGQLLRTFSGRSDIWIFPETQIHQVAAYQNASSLLMTLGLFHL